MKRRSSKLYRVFAALCGALLLVSCRTESVSPGMPDDPQDPQAWGVGPTMMLHISTLSYGAQSANAVVEERIKSLRIIMIHEEPDKKRYLEANRLIDIPDAGTDGEGDLASHFTYIFQKRTVVGKKSFYLIANEEEAQQVSVKNEGDGTTLLPESVSLTTLLNSYMPAMPSGKRAAADGVLPTDPTADNPDDPDTEADAAANEQAVAFEKLLQNLCLEPKQGLGSGKLYLPYSAYYHSGYDITEAGGYKVDMTNSPMYLVPVATKFTFKFINERTQDDGGLSIDKLVLRSTNKTNYLMANFDLTGFKNQEELHLVGNGGKEVHWIEWLRQVAAATNPTNPEDQTTDNVTDQNSSFGWISCYRVPCPEPKPKAEGTDGDASTADGPTADGPTDAVVYDFIDAYKTFSGNDLILDNAVPKPGSVDEVVAVQSPDIGPFYLPEGHHEEAKRVSDDPSVAREVVESYVLSIEMRPANDHDSESPKIKTAETEISNLKYLFRNTSIRITISLHEGGVKIYAQSEPWTYSDLWGYVQDEDDIKK